ncbi:uncharacterized protein I303_106712 [Kwoniella dejecticola CBS 10117]|uniref:Endoplasmic reticulum protein n=1 Tax=Kwoniella dejecticola CBS 10117 TaxID=1296121 RepID=A0A1A5ZU02_9TREE|nr:endoplasmic reticulum protein [Kwoniella dejecticola CBS 10117]OBR81260.1 endoplasmic reticulum protein [Kwoniella dejecticola CBS 10117]
MRLITCLLLLLATAASVIAWSKEDYEIFDLVSALEAAEGKGIDFYKHVGVESSATTSEINKAYRKKSLELHPDKNPGVKNIQERFARLGVIAQILRSPEGRERYNFFYKNGVPKWRGTGYYYSRYRPTLSHTLIFLVLLSSAFHYLVLNLNYRKHQRRIDYFQNAARSSAGVLGVTSAQNGEKVTVPVQGRRRKVRVPMVEGSDQGGTLELVVVGNDVFIPHGDGTLEPISGLAHPPSISKTWFFSLILSLYVKGLDRLPPSVQDSIPAFLQPRESLGSDLLLDEEEEPEEGESALDTPTPSNRAARRLQGKKSRSTTAMPRDSPATTELESGDEDGKGEKKKKLAGGKAGAARRRKMGLKK